MFRCWCWDIVVNKTEKNSCHLAEGNKKQTKYVKSIWLVT